MRQWIALVCASFMCLNLCGCVALLAGAAGGAGTAGWLSGKLIQQVQTPYDKSIEATKEALKSMNLQVERENRSTEVTQIRSHYADGRKIWIDVHPVTQSSSKIEVRVGAFGDKAASDAILKKILSKM